MSDSYGASADADRAVVNGAQEVSALRASIPGAYDWTIESAIRAEIVRVWGHYCMDGGAVLARAAIAAIEKAQAIEARRAETQGGSVHESAVRDSECAPSPGPTPYPKGNNDGR